MLSILNYLVLFSLAIILQLTVVPLLAIKGVVPDVILILVISTSFRHGKMAGMLWGFAAGVVFDFFSTRFVGASSLGYVVSAFVAGIWSAEHSQVRFGVVIGQLFLTVLLHDIIYLNIIRIGTSVGFWNTLFTVVFPHSLYSLVFVAIFSQAFPRKFLGRDQYNYNYN